MPVINSIDEDLIITFVIIFALILLWLMVKLFMFIGDFAQELRYLNCEINRASGAERQQWIRQRRRLWLSLIPFVKY